MLFFKEISRMGWDMFVSKFKDNAKTWVSSSRSEVILPKKRHEIWDLQPQSNTEKNNDKFKQTNADSTYSTKPNI